MKIACKSIFALFIFSVLCFMFLLPTMANAQFESLGLATYIQISDSKVENGHIISTSNKGFSLSRIPYDQAFKGVVNTEPAISLKNDDEKSGYPVVTEGSTQTKVTGRNGSIKKGDFITTSDIPGVGIKAAESGFVIGQALANVNFANKDETKLVLISLNPQHMQIHRDINNSITNIFKLSSVAAYEKPTRVLQYVVAAIITLISFGAGFMIFAKAINTGLEALGRNPLAGRMIQFSLIFNLIMIIVIVAVGVGLAYLVLLL